MKLKKVLAVSLTVSMMASMAACGSSSDTSSTNSSNDSAKDSASGTESAAGSSADGVISYADLKLVQILPLRSLSQTTERIYSRMIIQERNGMTILQISMQCIRILK